MKIGFTRNVTLLVLKGVQFDQIRINVFSCRGSVVGPLKHSHTQARTHPGTQAHTHQKRIRTKQTHTHTHLWSHPHTHTSTSVRAEMGTDERERGGEARERYRERWEGTAIVKTITLVLSRKESIF